MKWKFWQRSPAPTRDAHEKLVDHLLTRLERIRMLEGDVVRLTSEVSIQRQIKGQYRDLLTHEAKRVKDLGEMLPMIQQHVANLRGGVATPEHVGKELTLVHARMFEIVNASTSAIEALPKPDQGESVMSYSNSLLERNASLPTDTH